ncbi:MAG: hypothetical protein IJT30_00040 [Muribaculaceae bacterium]|nr:hypothetical protein [Muribaculaceae bacterium]
MKNKRNRLQLIVELVKGNVIGSQSELAERLAEQDIRVTQATLSRDLKALKITKIASPRGGYMYIFPGTAEWQNSSLLADLPLVGQHMGYVSLEFSGNFAVMKTRNGYAAGLAYDIDMSFAPELLGTIAGADTVFVVLREGITHEQARAVLEHILPHHKN